MAGLTRALGLPRGREPVENATQAIRSLETLASGIVRRRVWCPGIYERPRVLVREVS